MLISLKYQNHYFSFKIYEGLWLKAYSIKLKVSAWFNEQPEFILYRRISKLHTRNRALLLQIFWSVINTNDKRLLECSSIWMPTISFIRFYHLTVVVGEWPKNVPVLEVSCFLRPVSNLCTTVQVRGKDQIELIMFLSFCYSIVKLETLNSWLLGSKAGYFNWNYFILTRIWIYI